MRRLSVWLALWLAIVITVRALGATAWAATDDPYKTCLEQTSDNIGWAMCGDKEIQRQDARLNATWKKTRSCLDIKDEADKAMNQELVSEQRLWIKWKDRTCRIYNSGFGREGQVLDGPACKIKVIRDRVDWLEQFYNRACANR